MTRWGVCGLCYIGELTFLAMCVSTCYELAMSFCRPSCKSPTHLSLGAVAAVALATKPHSTMTKSQQTGWAGLVFRHQQG